MHHQFVQALLVVATTAQIAALPTRAQAQQAITLPEINASADKTLPIDVSQQNIPCAQIITRLEDYNRMARQHDLSVATFLGEVTGKMLSWHDLLQPLEGTLDAVPSGVFAPLQDGANKISAVTDLAYENSALLANEMDRLIQSLKECSLTATRRPL